MCIKSLPLCELIAFFLSLMLSLRPIFDLSLKFIIVHSTPMSAFKKIFCGLKEPLFERVFMKFMQVLIFLTKFLTKNRANFLQHIISSSFGECIHIAAYCACYSIHRLSHVHFMFSASVNSHWTLQTVSTYMKTDVCRCDAAWNQTHRVRLDFFFFFFCCSCIHLRKGPEKKGDFSQSY